MTELAAVLIGAGIGGLVTYSIAVRNGQNAHNAVWIPRSVDFLIEATEVSTEQYLMYARLLAAQEDDLAEAQRSQRRAPQQSQSVWKPSAQLAQRVDAGTTKWRGVLAKRNVYARDRLRDELQHFDIVRAKVVSRINAFDVAAARDELNQLKGDAYQALMLAIALERIDHQVVWANSLSWGRERKRLRTALLDLRASEEGRYDNLVEARGMPASTLNPPNDL